VEGTVTTTTFKDANIAILESRMSSEMEGLIRRYGARPYSVQAVREVSLEPGEPVAAFIDHLGQLYLRVVIFMTGVGVTALFREAEKQGRLSELLDLLRKAIIVCRGPKPSAVLKRYGIPVLLKAEEPYTTEELLTTLALLDLKGKGVAVIHYGERNTRLAKALLERDAHIEELCLYQWQLPEDITPLQALVHDIIDRKVDAVVFTSQVQVRHLFQVARDLQLADELRLALNTRTIVASIGPTCSAALEYHGVTPHVLPEHPKMGHLVKALSIAMT
jgi:uroporphyrinogen-III synthase